MLLRFLCKFVGRLSRISFSAGILNYHGGKMLVRLHISCYRKVTNSDYGFATYINQNLGEHSTDYISVAHSRCNCLQQTKGFQTKVLNG